jgi:DNA-binding CsgD family transcriptional regulator
VGDHPPFSQKELELASYTLRSLNWFHKQLFLSYGLLAAEKPLTPTEKRVMHLLLTELSEKQIADMLQQKVDTTHKHIVNIYRKFNVNSRAALMAIWLGHS